METEIFSTVQSLQGDKVPSCDHMVFSSLLDSVPLNIYAKDTSGTFIFANRNYCKAIDKELQAIIGKTDYDLHPSELAEKYLADDRLIIATRETRMIEESWRSIDGDVHYVQVIKSAFVDNGDSDRVLGTVGVFWDITERKNTELLIKEERNFLRTVIDSIPSFVYVKDVRSRFVIANQAVADFVGVATPDDLIGKSDADFFPADVAALFSQQEEHLFTTGEPVDGVVESYVFKGQRYWVRTTKKLLHNLDGELVGLVGVGYDITDIKLIENRLRESEERYAAVVNQAVEGIYLVDPETKQVLESNESFQEMLGYSPEDMAACRIYDFVLHSREDVDAVLNKALARREYVIGDRQYRLKNGGILNVEVTAKLIQYGGNTAVLVIVRDTSERKKVEQEKERLLEQLRQAQKLEAIGTLAGGVAHDLNNILAGIVSYPEIMLMTLPQESPYRRKLEVIQESGLRAAAVVADLLTVARGVASTKGYHLLNTLVTAQLESPENNKLVKQYPQIDYDVRLDSNVGTIFCSPVHVKKCVMNLVINAAEAIGGQGKIRVRTRAVTVDSEDAARLTLAAGKYYTIIISDNGPGISLEDVNHIFEPFYTKKKMGSSGSGLGLSIVWNTMLDHEGTVSVESGAQGSTFILYFLAAHHQPNLAACSVQVQDVQGHGERILVVDDDLHLLDIAEQMLSELGYRIFVANSGEEAVLFLENNKVDLVMLDMIMEPGIDGYTTYARILERNPGQKAVIVSGFSASKEVEETQRLGAGKFVIKPYTMQTLGNAIKQELMK